MTFKQLRQQKNEIKNRLNIANNTVSLQIDEIAILTKTIKTSYEYWLEMIAFYSIYFSLILQLIQ